MINPNIAFRDRSKKLHKRGHPAVTIVFTGDDHLVHFSCPRCMYKYETVFHRGMTLHTENLLCPTCKREQMDYKID